MLPSISWGECRDCSAHPPSEGSLCSHNNEATHSLLLHQALDVDDLLCLSGFSLSSMGSHICHALACRIGPPAETVLHSVVVSWDVDHHQYALRPGFVLPAFLGGWSEGVVHVLLEQRLQTLMGGAHCDGI